jgi:hypothetical protein
MATRLTQRQLDELDESLTSLDQLSVRTINSLEKRGVLTQAAAPGVLCPALAYRVRGGVLVCAW